MCRDELLGCVFKNDLVKYMWTPDHYTNRFLFQNYVVALKDKSAKIKNSVIISFY